MKKIFITLLVLFLFVPSCRKTDAVPVKLQELGKTSLMMQFAGVSEVKAGTAIISLSVTPGAKYSIQLSGISGEMITSVGLTADEVRETVTLSVKDLKPGIYDITVVDIAGLEMKQPLIIN